MNDFFSPQRRPWLTEPGEHLLLPGAGATPLHAIVRARLNEAVTQWGVMPGDLLATPLVAVPLPEYDDGGFDDGSRRWAGTRAEAMWHPLMWLPERLAQRYELAFPDGTARIESDMEYSVRLALEIESSGLYDPANGWVDVLALHGLDIDEPTTVDRVRRWLLGQDDAVLDSIDLSDWTEHPAEPDWALAHTQVLIEDLIACSWVIAAEGLTSDLLTLAQSDRAQTDFVDAHLTFSRLARVSRDWLGTVPVTPDDADVAGVVENVLGWAEDIATSDQSLPRLLDGPVGVLLEAVDAVRSNPVLTESFDSLNEATATY